MDVGGRVLPPKTRQGEVRLDYSEMVVTLEGEGQVYKSYVYPNGLFKFTNIPHGMYIMRTDDLNNLYDSVAIEIVSSKGKDRVIASLYDHKNGKGKQVKHPLQMSPTMPKMYYEVKEPLNILNMLKSPMVLMMIVSLGLVLLMNKMPKPDKTEMDEMGKQMGNFKMPSFLTGGQ